MTEVPDPEPILSGDAIAIGSEGGTAEFAGVSIRVPGDAVPDGAEVTVAAGVTPGLYAGEAWGTPLSVEHSEPLEAPSTVTWDVSRLDTDQRDALLLVRWDPGIAAWVPQDIPSRIDGDRLIAEIKDFSFWDWVANFGQEYGEVIGTRVDAPVCSGEPHEWVRQVISPSEDLEAAGVGVCFEPDRGEVMKVKVTNNRTFTQQMEMIRGGQSWAWTWPGEETVGIDQAAYAAARMVFDTDTRYLLPPLRQVHVGVDRPDEGGHIGARIDVSPTTVATDVMVYALDQLPIGGLSNPHLNAAMQAAFSCFGKQALGGGYTDAEGLVRDVVDSLAGCADQAFTTTGSDFSDVVIDSMDNAKYVRTTQYLSSALRTLKYAEIAYYASDLFADAAVDPLTWSIRGNARPGTLGQWSPTCTDLDRDANLLYRNLALQDEFADTSVEFHDFPGWADAGAQAVAPLREQCNSIYNQQLAARIVDTWADTEAAQIVADSLSSGRRPPNADGSPLAQLSITFQGLGPLLLGSSVQQAEATGLVSWDPAHCPADIYGEDTGALEAAAGLTLAPGSNPIGLEGWPSFGVDVDVDAGAVRWIQVLDPAVATDTGIRVGDPAARLDAVYGADLRYGDDSSIGQESYVRWVRKNGVDIVFDVLSGPEGLANPGVPVVWSISAMSSTDSHYSNYRSDVGAGFC